MHHCRISRIYIARFQEKKSIILVKGLNFERVGVTVPECGALGGARGVEAIYRIDESAEKLILALDTGSRVADLRLCCTNETNLELDAFLNVFRGGGG